MAKMELWVELRALTQRFQEDIKKATTGAARSVSGGAGSFAQGVGGGFFGGMGGAGGGRGVTGLLGGIVGKLGIIGLAIDQGSKLVGQLVGIFAKSSPIFKGTLDILERSFMLFMKPFGDFLGTLLRPLAIALLKMAVGWIKWSRQFGESFGKLMAGDLAGFLKDVVIGSFHIGEWLGKSLVGFITGIFNFNDWLIRNIPNFITGLFEFNLWLAENIIDFFNQNELFDFGRWIGENIWNFIQVTTPFNLVSWLAEQITKIITGQQITAPITRGATLPPPTITSQVQQDFMNLVPPSTQGESIENLRKWFASFQVGSLFVPRTGLAMVHRGEQVIPAGQGGRSVTVQNHFHFPNLTVERTADFDAIITRANTLAELDTRRRIPT